MLANEFVARKFDIKWLLRELALTQTYQRSSLLPSGLERESLPDRYVVAIEKPLSTEQLMWSILQATGELPRYQPTVDTDGKPKPNAPYDDLKKRFVAAFANPPRDPEVDFAPSVKAALFLSNDGKVLELLKPRDGNLTEQLVKETDSTTLAELLYFAILTRTPSPDEAADVAKYLAAHADDRTNTVGQLIWAIIASTEFCVNH